jgi:regulator of PEP synthase PpsR (kinase-PPPase family)
MSVFISRRIEETDVVGRSDKTGRTGPPAIYIVSGGAGASGEQVVHTVLAQYPKIQIRVVTVAHVNSTGQIMDVINRVKDHGGFIVHTLVDSSLRDTMNALGEKNSVKTIDLMGEMFGVISDMLGQAPVGRPGLYRQLNREYFERVEAIEFSMLHDDGRNPQGCRDADIVLIGVSRVGKTPISMYLSVLGWKVANIPFIKDQALPQEIFEIDHGRIIGLVIDSQRLVLHRRTRHEKIAGKQPSAYTDPVTIFEELEQSRNFFKTRGFSVIDISNKPLETTADEIIGIITKRFF